MTDSVFQIKISRDLSQSKLVDTAGLARALLHAMDEQNALTVAHIQDRYASFPADEPTTMEGLRAISTRLRASYNASAATITATGVTSDIGSNVVYAAIQEFGGQTGPHVPEYGAAFDSAIEQFFQKG